LPFDKTKEVNDEARKAIATLIKVALAAMGGDLVKTLTSLTTVWKETHSATIAAVLESDDWR